jgi:hypothetical protein
MCQKGPFGPVLPKLISFGWEEGRRRAKQRSLLLGQSAEKYTVCLILTEHLSKTLA